MCEKKDEFDQFPDNLEDYERFVGIDPGRTYAVTAFDGSMKGKKSNMIQVSTKEYRTRANMIEFQKWELRLREREKRYQDIIKDLPSLKTSSLLVFRTGVQKILEVGHWLLEFHAEKPFRKWAFKQVIYKKKALNLICKRLTQGKKTLVGFGDWSQQDGGFLKGSPKSNVKGLKQELRKHATVVKIDEHRTSKTCSCCHGEVAKIKQWRMEKGERKLSQCHEVVRCKNESCMKSWQRDINASRNMFHLLQCQVKGENRPLAMERKRVKRSKSSCSGTEPQI
jgi:hypothetical protein